MFETFPFSFLEQEWPLPVIKSLDKLSNLFPVKLCHHFFSLSLSLNLSLTLIFDINAFKSTQKLAFCYLFSKMGLNIFQTLKCFSPLIKFDSIFSNSFKKSNLWEKCAAKSSMSLFMITPNVTPDAYLDNR